MDLTTHYLGLKLAHPITASASPLSRSLSGIHQLEDGGASAIVLYSLFAEQIEESDRPERGLDYFPDWNEEPVGPDEYLDLVSLAKRTASVPIIASLNGATPGTWTRYARLIEGAGADALELNLYYVPTATSVTSADMERRCVETVQVVKESVGIPVAVKIGPFFSALPHLAAQLADAGADALVLFNRFYQPDIDPETRNVALTRAVLSDADHDLRLPLRWVSLLYGVVDTELALTGGVHAGRDAVKAVMAGANVVQMASELLINGPGRLGGVRDEMAQWMQEHECESVADLFGQMAVRRRAADASEFERAGYVKTLRSTPAGTAGGAAGSVFV